MRQGAGSQSPDDQVTPGSVLVGAGLPAMRATGSVRQTTVMQSQASQLPHLTCCVFETCLSRTTENNPLEVEHPWLQKTRVQAPPR
ncbi:hypothetical protein D7M10_01590 [Pseudomonas fluorescens]|nr:hypothetical protein D7M10_01590 [Pseudomonas fluorescens]